MTHGGNWPIKYEVIMSAMRPWIGVAPQKKEKKLAYRNLETKVCKVLPFNLLEILRITKDHRVGLRSECTYQKSQE